MLNQNLVKLTIKKLPKTDTLVLTQQPDNSVFLTTKDSVIISISSYVTILNYLVKNSYINKKTLVGILEELNTL